MNGAWISVGRADIDKDSDSFLAKGFTKFAWNLSTINNTVQSGSPKTTEFWLVVGAEPSSILGFSPLASWTPRLTALWMLFYHQTWLKLPSALPKYRQYALQTWQTKQRPNCRPIPCNTTIDVPNIPVYAASCCGKWSRPTPATH